MDWKLAEAKQQLSKVVRLAQNEPQIIQNRDEPVAVVVSVSEYDRFREWKRRGEATLDGAFEELRRVAGEEGWELEVPARADRPNAVLDLVAAEPPPGRARRRRHVDRGGRQ